MSIARALTKRIKQSEEGSGRPFFGQSSTASTNAGDSAATSPAASIHRSTSRRNIDRAQISLPVSLLSTTNVLAYEAPDIYPQKAPSQHHIAGGASPANSFASNPLSPAPSSAHPATTPLSPLGAVAEEEPALSSAASTRSVSSGAQSDASVGPASTAPSSVGSPLISREASPAIHKAPAPPELNHLSTYFQQAQNTNQSRPSPISKTEAHPLPRTTSPVKALPRRPSVDTTARGLGQTRTPPTPASAVPASAASVHSFPTKSPATPSAPAVPARSRTHTAHTHQALARQRSVRSGGSGSSGEAPAPEEGRSRAAAFAGAAALGVALDLSEETPEPTPNESEKQVPPPPPSTDVAALTASKLRELDARSPTPSAPATKAAAAAAAAPAPAPAPASASTADNPFGAELAQVKEVAQSFGVRDVRIWDEEEEQFLVDNGLCKFAADDYIGEILPLFRGVFAVEEAETWL